MQIRRISPYQVRDIPGNGTAARHRCRSGLVFAAPATASPGVPFGQLVAHKPLRSSAISALKLGGRGVMGDTTPGEPGAIYALVPPFSCCTSARGEHGGLR